MEEKPMFAEKNEACKYHSDKAGEIRNADVTTLHLSVQI
jgi:hypothetical protein